MTGIVLVDPLKAGIFIVFGLKQMLRCMGIFPKFLKGCWKKVWISWPLYPPMYDILKKIFKDYAVDSNRRQGKSR